ncbi:hypothetical protein LCGC14_1335340 [marine sediment metagenome]|uniref:Uncharacterized protein n=1 Tax=marine sediment metagenome TaxID=412755 RepID=A0A0F9KFA6_9ZZZZ
MNFDSTVCLEDVILIRETYRGRTDKGAVLVVYQDDQQWIPKSQIHPHSGIPWEPGERYLVISRWIAGLKGWDYNVG